MAQRRSGLPLKVAFAGLLMALSLALAAGQGVTTSDNPKENLPEYRYLMNGSQLMSNVGPVQLAPLSDSLWKNLSPEKFARPTWRGQLTNFDASTAQDFSSITVPYISCDNGDVLSTIHEAFNTTNEGNVEFAVLYSVQHDYCVISDQLASADWLNISTVVGSQQAQIVAELDLSPESQEMVSIQSDPNSLPSEAASDSEPKRNSNPIPMIVLYSLTSLITTLLLFVIICGAIKARRHPDRYGPQSVFRPRQSRAKGIAMAMLETLPIIKFGDPDPKKSRRSLEEGSVEMSGATKTPHVELEGAEPKPSPSRELPQNSPTTSTDILPAGAQQDAADRQDALNVPQSPPRSHKSSDVTADQSDSRNMDDSLSCSICTEDFTIGEEARVLPCDHRFHPNCVDPWLLNVSGTCPLCRIDLRSPQEDVEGGATAPAIATSRGLLSIPARPRSTVGSIMRGSRGLELQAIIGASREERIGILRRWRDELRQRESSTQDERNESTEVRRRSLRFSQWLRDGSFGRPSPESHPGQDAIVSPSSMTARPRSWFGYDRSVPVVGEEESQVSTARNDTSMRETRARTWYGDAGSPQENHLSQSTNSDARPPIVTERAES